MAEVLIFDWSPSPGRSMSWKAAAFGLTGLAALAIMVGTGAAEVWEPDESVKVVAAEDRARAGADEDIRFRDGSMARAAERRIKLSSPVRREVSPWWSAALLRFLDDAPSDVVVGRDGCLFLRERSLLPAVAIKEGPATVANYIYAVQRRAATRGIQYISLPVPRKCVVLKDWLPNGVDEASRMEHQLYVELEARGCHFINALKAWEAVDPLQCYNSKDSHWAIPAQVEVSRALVKKYPELKRSDHGSIYESEDGPSRMALLRYCGIPSGHPARKLFPSEAHGKITLKDETTWKRISAGDFVGDVVLGGTSFVRSSSLHAILALVTHADVESCGFNGAAMTQSFGQLMEDRAETGDYPSIVVDEFPTHQLQHVVTGTRPTWRAFAQVFTALTVGELADFGGEPAPVMIANKRHLVAARGSLVSSGDGALSLEIVAMSDHESNWILQTPGCRFDVLLKGAGSKAVIPVIEASQWAGSACIYPKDNKFSEASISIRPVVEGAFDETEDIPLKPAANAAEYRSDGSLPVGANETFLIEWSEPCAELRIELKGLDADGAPVEDSWVFHEPKTTSAAISPRRIGGGTLSSVRIVGPDESVVLHRVRVGRQ